MGVNEDRPVSEENKMKIPEKRRHVPSRDVMPGSDIWKDGLICAFEFVRGNKKPMNSRYGYRVQGKQSDDECSKEQMAADSQGLDGQKSMESSFSLESRDRVPVSFDENNTRRSHRSDQYHAAERFDGSCWVPIGWDRISDLVKNVQVNGVWDSQQFEWIDIEDGLTVADLAAPYWERPDGPIWWCHLASVHPNVEAFLNNAQWLHPAVSLALRDESKLISERMKHLLYEVPVRVAGGLLFELLGQSAGDPYVEEDDIPIVLRSWQAQNFLLTVLHIKGNVSGVNVLGITEVQELLSAGGYNVPRTVHDVIAYLASRLTRWDDRLFRKSIFGEADEIELKFMNRRNQEDMNLFAIILNQEIQRLSRQVIRVKWSLHAREEIVFELMQHLRGNTARSLLEGIRKSTRQMIEEQEAVRDRLFTIQDVMQSTVRAWLQVCIKQNGTNIFDFDPIISFQDDLATIFA